MSIEINHRSPRFHQKISTIENLLKNLKDQFFLDPKIIYLNHGSFGACPRPVIGAYQSWQRILEHQPVEFLDRRALDLTEESRTKLAVYLGVNADEVIYFPNPTTAINMVARSLSKLLALQAATRLVKLEISERNAELSGRALQEINISFTEGTETYDLRSALVVLNEWQGLATGSH